MEPLFDHGALLIGRAFATLEARGVSASGIARHLKVSEATLAEYVEDPERTPVLLRGAIGHLVQAFGTQAEDQRLGDAILADFAQEAEDAGAVVRALCAGQPVAEAIELHDLYYGNPAMGHPDPAEALTVAFRAREAGLEVDEYAVRFLGARRP